MIKTRNITLCGGWLPCQSSRISAFLKLPQEPEMHKEDGAECSGPIKEMKEKACPECQS